jgi:hypothetical protein
MIVGLAAVRDGRPVTHTQSQRVTRLPLSRRSALTEPHRAIWTSLPHDSWRSNSQSMRSGPRVAVVWLVLGCVWGGCQDPFPGLVDIISIIDLRNIVSDGAVRRHPLMPAAGGYGLADGGQFATASLVARPALVDPMAGSTLRSVTGRPLSISNGSRSAAPFGEGYSERFRARMPHRATRSTTSRRTSPPCP